MPEYPETVSVAKGVSMTFLRDQPYLTKVVVSGNPDADTLFVPLHWHETHDEIICVREGQLKVVLGSEVKLCTPETGDVVIPKGTPHSLQSIKGVRCVFEERTEPMDDEKEIFFRNIFAAGGMAGSLLPVMQVFYYGDTRPVFPLHLPWLEKLFVTCMGYYVAPLLGYRRTYEELKKTQ